MQYHKLVRDKVPEIIRQKGENPVSHIASDEEYWTKLKRKLMEEAAEFGRDESLEEIADVLEVIRAIAAYKKIPDGELERLRQKKYNERGGFEGRVILDEA